MVNHNIKDWGFGGKYRTKEKDDEYRAKAKGVPKWTKERCIIRINDIIDRLDKILLQSEKIESNPSKLKSENITDLRIMMNTLLDFMRYLYPPVQQNVNLNVDMTATAVIERLREWKKKKELEAKK